MILSSRWVLFIAKLLQFHLKKLGIYSQIITEIPQEGFSNCLHIVLCPQVFKFLPQKYVVFQLEQLSENSKSWNDRYKLLLRNAIAVFDYSCRNINFLQNSNLKLKRLFYLPIFSKEVRLHRVASYKYDILFYGSLTERRKLILTQLKKDFSIHIITNVFGEKILDEIRQSRVVINLHSYDNSLLESARLAECLSLGKVVISESGIDQENYKYFEDIVHFVPPGNLDELKQTIKDVLKNTNFYDQEKIIAKKIKSRFDIFMFYLARGLFALGFISFENVKQCLKNKWPEIDSVVSLIFDESELYRASESKIPALRYLTSTFSREFSVMLLTHLAFEQKKNYLVIDMGYNNDRHDAVKQEVIDKLIKLKKPTICGDSLLIPSVCYEEIINWNYFPSLADEGKASLLTLFEKINSDL